jgi:hypothetical protein
VSWSRRWCRKFQFLLNHGASLNRRAEVEEQLSRYARGARGPISPEEARDMANKLGNPYYVAQEKQ